MKRVIALIPVAALLVSAACASAPRLPPKESPDEVQLYDPQAGHYPEPGYKTIGPVKVEMPLGTSVPDLLLKLREEAAKLGADAVILQRVRTSTEGAVTFDMNRQDLMIAEGLAIYYPRPETQTQTETQP
ncbi:MAG TPA: hypothetical protein VKZ58_00895 [Longimicrobiales bacterium]|nr:hypothetical protein [Longimicrobiales bacterium]